MGFDIRKVFVESLDRCFENVCELDLIFHFDDVRVPISSPHASSLTLVSFAGAHTLELYHYGRISTRYLARIDPVQFQTTKECEKE